MDKIHRIKCGSGNCYVVENGTEGILVDTGRKEFAGRVAEACRAYRVKLILLTHAHFDHAENAALLSEQFGIPIAMNRGDCGLIPSNAAQSLAAETLLGKVVLSASLRDFSTRPAAVFRPDLLVDDGSSLLEYGLHARIVALPGHTDGSIGVDVEGDGLIVGDALMNLFYPTVSMLYHNREQMLESAKKISGLGNRTVYFGHGRPVRNRRWVK